MGDIGGLAREDVELRRECEGDRGVATVEACVAALMTDEAAVLIDRDAVDDRDEGGERVLCG